MEKTVQALHHDQRKAEAGIPQLWNAGKHRECLLLDLCLLSLLKSSGNIFLKTSGPI